MKKKKNEILGGTRYGGDEKEWMTRKQININD